MKNVSYKVLTTISDEMCSMMAVHLEELNLIVFMVYQPPPNYKNIYHGDVIEIHYKSC